MSLPSITIVTPTYNQGNFIRSTIDSVLGQDYPNLEYLVLDAGSTDATLEILQSYGSQIRWISGPDAGQTDAINKGWSMTRGEILAWLNSDDILFPGALKQVGQFFYDHPEVGLAYGQCDYIDESGQLISAYPVQPFDLSTLLFKTINYIPQPATFLRRSVYESTGPLDNSLKYVMDFDYWLRVGIKYPSVFVPERWAGLRLHSMAKSVASLGKFADELVTIYQKFFQQNDLPEHIKLGKSKAMAAIYTRAMDCAFWAGDVAKARQYAVKAWLAEPGRIRKLWLYLILGKAGYQLASRYQRNPYTALR